MIRHDDEADASTSSDGAVGGVIVDTPLSSTRSYVEIEILAIPAAANCCVGLGATRVKDPDAVTVFPGAL